MGINAKCTKITIKLHISKTNIFFHRPEQVAYKHSIYKKIDNKNVSFIRSQINTILKKLYQNIVFYKKNEELFAHYLKKTYLCRLFVAKINP